MRERPLGRIAGVHGGWCAARRRLRADARRGPRVNAGERPRGQTTRIGTLIGGGSSSTTARSSCGSSGKWGVTEIFIDGSFLEDKDHPNDIDGYFECDWREFVSGALQDRLNQLDPHRAWTWDPAERRPYRSYPKKQLPMWHQYRVEPYPHLPGLIAGHDGRGNPLEFPAFFRTSCRPLPSGATQKGIVRIRRQP